MSDPKYVNERATFLRAQFEVIEERYQREIRETENELQVIWDACEHMICPKWDWHECCKCGYYLERRERRAEAQEKGKHENHIH